MIGVIDYGAGNFSSVYNALNAVSNKIKIVTDKKDLSECSHVVLPGVGTFGSAIARLNTMDLVDALYKNVIEKGKFFLGICVGMQLLAEKGYEFGEHSGLGFVKGRVEKLKIDYDKFSLPHMGWNDIINPENSPLFEGLDETASFYFVHSFHLIVEDESVKTVRTHYGAEFVSAISSGNIHGVQFHPEKSQFDGLKLLSNFVNLK